MRDEEYDELKAGGRGVDLSDTSDLGSIRSTGSPKPVVEPREDGGFNYAGSSWSSAMAGEKMGAAYSIKASMSGGFEETSPKPSRRLPPVIKRDFS